MVSVASHLSVVWGPLVVGTLAGVAVIGDLSFVGAGGEENFR